MPKVRAKAERSARLVAESSTVLSTMVLTDKTVRTRLKFMDLGSSQTVQGRAVSFDYVNVC